MNREKDLAADIKETAGIPLALVDIFSEKPAGTQQLENRWNKSFSAVFSYMAEAVCHFFLSHIQTKDMEAIQSYIHRIFCKTNEIAEIKTDYHQQNAFLMGYCHAINQLVDTYESEISYEKNKEIETIISSYKYVTPILEVLDKKFELSHKELADSIGISVQALSNVMNRVKRYYFFNVTQVGKKKYYSIASPNGEEALKIINKRNKISRDGYTDLLLKIMDSLIDISTCDELGKEHVMKQCEKMVREYTTKPDLCMQKLDELALISKSERVYYVSLILLERKAEKTVTVFTRDFKSEREFGPTIVENLMKNVRYQWFITKEDEQDSIEEIQQKLYTQIQKDTGLNDMKWKTLKNNMHCYLIPQWETDNLLGEIYDAVIYDENNGFICMDRTIEKKTPYFQMPEDRVEILNRYASERMTG